MADSLSLQPPGRRARRLYVLRHGETDLNARRIVQPPETPLSARGLEQARRLAARLAGEGIARVLTSDLSRARRTAAELAHSTGAPLEIEPLLQERNFGDVRGTPYAELGFDLFAADYAPPNGESWETFHRRVQRAWVRVLETADRTEGPVAVVTHGLVCRAFAERHLQRATGDDPGAALPRSWSNTSVTIAEGPPWRIRLLNCTAHLDGDAPAW